VNLGANANAADTALLNIKQAGASYNQGIYIERGGERNGYHMYIGGALDSLTFRRNYFGTQSDVMSLTRDGNVGIGTDSPGFQLTLNKNDNNYLQIRSSDAGAAGIYFGRQNDSVRGGIYYDNSTDALYFQTFNLTTNTVITSGGNVLVGTTSDSAGVRLKVEGGIIGCVDVYNNTTGVAANMQIDSNGFMGRSTVSSLRFKEEIEDWTGGLDVVMALKPRTFKYKKDYYDKADVDFLGLIAEEVSEVCPYLVDYENEDRTGQEENVRYANIVVPLIKAIQELKTEIDSLKNQIK
jgi:hypothetical protein